MIKRLAVILFFAVITFPSMGQYKFQFAQYQQTALAYNPGFTGIEDFIDIKIGYRNRWAGLDNSPTTSLLTTNLAVKIFENNKYRRRGVRLVEPEAFQRLETSNEFQYRKSRRQGFGAWVMQNDAGAVKELGGFLTYAYHLPISDYIIWSVGTSIGVANSKIDGSNLTVTDPDNDAIYQAYLNGNESSTNAVINLGTVLYAKNWYVSYAANNLVNSSISSVVVENPFTENYNIQHNVMVAFEDNPKYGLKLMPSALIEYASNAPIGFTIGLRARYEDAIWGGLAYRHDDAVNLSLGFYLTSNISLNYAFEYSISEISGLNTASSHELILGFKLNNKNFSRAYMW